MQQIHLDLPLHRCRHLQMILIIPALPATVWDRCTQCTGPKERVITVEGEVWNAFLHPTG